MYAVVWNPTIQGALKRLVVFQVFIIFLHILGSVCVVSASLCIGRAFKFIFAFGPSDVIN
jgi:hypothetical protein